MEKIGRHYNLQLLGNTTWLNTDEGIRKCGSRRDYFRELGTFVEGIPALAETLNPMTPKKDLLTQLSILHSRLEKICESRLTRKIEELSILIGQNLPEGEIYEVMREVKNEIGKLCSKISEAEMSQEDYETLSLQPQKEDIPEKPKAPVQAALFVPLLPLVEKYEFDAAIREVKNLLKYSYTDTIDRLLERILQNLEDFNDTGAVAGIKMLQKAVPAGENTVGEMQKSKILAIDDMPDILNTIKSVLKSQYNVYCVTNHTAALKFLSTNAPDLILLDIEMPEMDGFELIKIIRQIDACKKTPVLFLTGNVSVENIKMSVERGGNDFIKKPVDSSVLLAKIKKHLS